MYVSPSALALINEILKQGQFADDPLLTDTPYYKNRSSRAYPAFGAAVRALQARICPASLEDVKAQAEFAGKSYQAIMDIEMTDRFDGNNLPDDESLLADRKLLGNRIDHAWQLLSSYDPILKEATRDAIAQVCEFATVPQFRVVVDSDGNISPSP